MFSKLPGLETSSYSSRCLFQKESILFSDVVGGGGGGDVDDEVPGGGRYYRAVPGWQ